MMMRHYASICLKPAENGLLAGCTMGPINLVSFGLDITNTEGGRRVGSFVLSPGSTDWLIEARYG